MSPRSVNSHNELYENHYLASPNEPREQGDELGTSTSVVLLLLTEGRPGFVGEASEDVQGCRVAQVSVVTRCLNASRHYHVLRKAVSFFKIAPFYPEHI